MASPRPAPPLRPRPPPPAAARHARHVAVAAAPSLGIDLGTSTSAAAVCVAGEPRLVTLPGGRTSLPSVVHYPEDGGPPLVGAAALAARGRAPETTFFGVKRLLGRTPADVAAFTAALPYRTQPSADGKAVALVCPPAPGGLLAPADVSAEVLRTLVAAAAADIGTVPTRAVVSVPAYFDAAARAATLAAAKAAGLTTVRLIKEPVAAALGYGLRPSAPADETVLVLDMGGGTFDVSLLEVGGGVVEVLATGGDAALGGEDWDAAIAARLADTLLAPAGIKPDDPTVAGQLRAAAEAAKRALSGADGRAGAKAVTVTLAPPGPDGRPVEIKGTLDRGVLDAVGTPLFARAARAVDDACFQAGVDLTASLDAWRASSPSTAFALRPKSRPPVSRTLLVGGGTRVAGFDAFVEHCVGVPPDPSAVDRDAAVALGAALQAGALDGDPALEGVMVLDVLQASLARALAEAALAAPGGNALAAGLTGAPPKRSSKPKGSGGGKREAKRRGAAPPQA